MALKVRIIATDTLSGTLLGVGKKVLRLGTQFVKFGAMAATAIAGISIKLASDLDKGLREIGTLMGGLTDKEMKNMGSELMRIASLSGQAMSSLTKAKYDIVSAGFTKAADSAIMLEQSAIVAVGGVTDMATAADLLTTALNSYSKSADEANDVSDILFTTVRLGKTTMGELGGSMGRLLAISGQMDISLTEMGAALATLTAGGQNTAEATTAIRASIVQLMQPQTELAKLIEGTSYKTTLALLASEGYAGTLKVIKDEAKKAGIPMTDLFNNVRAMQAVLPLTGIAAEKFSDNLVEFESRAGSAQGAYEEMQESFAVTTARLKQNVNNMLISLGTKLIEKLQPKIDNFNTVMEGMGELDWAKLADILTTNWKLILLTVANLGIMAGKIIGEKLAIAIGDSIKKRFPNITALFTSVSDEMREALTALLGVIEDPFQNKNPNDAWLDLEPDFDEGIKTITTFGEAWENAAKILVDLVTPAFSGVKKLIKEVNEGLDESAPDTTNGGEGFKKIKTAHEKYLEWYESEGTQSFLDTTAQVTQAVGDLYGNLLNMRKAQIQSELNEQINAVLASGASEEQKQAKISNLREKAQQKEIEFAKKLKPIKMAQAISNTAAAVVGALGNKPWSPFNFALAGLVAAAGAAEVATIAASPYAQGGFVRGGNIPSSDTIPAMLSPREIVSTAAASERFGADIQRLNQIAESGLSSGSGGDKFYINAIDPQSFLEAIKRQPEKFAEAMQLVKSERYL